MSRTSTVLCLGAALVVSACGFTGNYRLDPGFASFTTPSSIPNTDRRIGVSVGAIPIRLATLMSRPLFREEPWIPNTLEHIRAVRVYMYEIGEDFETVRQSMEALKAELLVQGWDAVAAVREDGGLVSALVMSETPERVRGVVVLYQDHEELVLVNVIGCIDPETIGALLAGLEIEIPLMEVDIV